MNPIRDSPCKARCFVIALACLRRHRHIVLSRRKTPEERQWDQGPSGRFSWVPNQGKRRETLHSGVTPNREGDGRDHDVGGSPARQLLMWGAPESKVRLLCDFDF
ncbi:hypothetical protein VTN77DRAFT_3728 [Rasamsonia byssochlamydoides]|uniref:uncharacterized protein n=1 Tax=Rasamsonia byssochlamydoides TaxID=89139 RepID=UPI003743610F